MPWIKRNLPFVIGGAVALVLMGVAAFFFFSNLSKDRAVTEELNAEIEELRRISQASVHPGTDEVDNISAARKEQERVRAFLADARKLFVPVPTYQKIDDRGFNNLLGFTINELQVAASNAGVMIPPDYAFTFQAQRGMLSFAPGSIEPWTAQLSEIKTICSILFQARINALEGLRRVPVSTNDVAGTADYLNATIVTNDISVVTPYEVVFRSFSGELADVMNGILRATNCLIVKSINVEPSRVPLGGEDMGYQQPGLYPQAGYPPYSPAPQRGEINRYGGLVGEPAPARPYAPAPVPGQIIPGRPGTAAGPVVFQSEKPLRITLLIDVVKLTPPR